MYFFFLWKKQTNKIWLTSIIFFYNFEKIFFTVSSVYYLV